MGTVITPTYSYIHHSLDGDQVAYYVEIKIGSWHVQRGKAYCTGFCASLAELVGSGNNAGRCDEKNGGLLMKYVRMSFG